MLGELGFIAGIKRTATASAIGETTLGLIDRGFLEKEYNQLSGQFRGILRIATLRLKKMLDRSCDFTRRAKPRLPQALLVTYKDRQTFFRDYTSNISTGGLFLKTDNPLNQGAQLLLKLQLPGAAEPMQIKCEVMWSRSRQDCQPDQAAGMGVKFCEMSKNHFQLLKQFLARK